MQFLLFKTSPTAELSADLCAHRSSEFQLELLSIAAIIPQHKQLLMFGTLSGWGNGS